MRFADIKNASENKQQNQTTTTTNIIYSKNSLYEISHLRFIKQNLITKSKKRQIKLKITKITCILPTKNGCSPVHNKAW